MNTPIIRLATATTSYVALSTTTLVAGRVVITALSTNTGIIYLQGTDGNHVPVNPGDWYEFVGINLAAVSIKGTAGDKVTVIGNS